MGEDLWTLRGCAARGGTATLETTDSRQQLLLLYKFLSQIMLDRCFHATIGIHHK